MSQYSAEALRGALVVVEEPSKTRAATNPSTPLARRSKIEEFSAEFLMRPFAVVVVDEVRRSAERGAPRAESPDSGI